MVQEVNAALRRIPAGAVYLLGLVPLAWLVGLGFTGGLGADPVKAVEHSLGLTGLQLIVAGLCVTPLRAVTGISLLRFRRALGLMAFLYVTLHLLVWVLLDLQLRWAEMGADIVKRPYILAGFIGFLLMVPLAATSNDRAVRRMGALAWRQLHRLTYGVALAGAIHFLWLVKTWRAEPVVYLAAILALLAVRAVLALRRRAA
jgi:methionine sulfoxide reductase heme-binding subunit